MAKLKARKQLGAKDRGGGASPSTLADDDD